MKGNEWPYPPISFLPFFLLIDNYMSLILIGDGYVMIVDINLNFVYSDYATCCPWWFAMNMIVVVESDDFDFMNIIFNLWVIDELRC